MKCDDCGCPTDAESDPASGIILCDLCASDKRKTTEEIIAELEAEGVDVQAFMRRIYATIERAKAKHTANAALTGGVAVPSNGVVGESE